MKLTISFHICLLAFAFLVFGCGSGSENNSDATTDAPAVQEKPPSPEEKYKDDPDFVRGLALIQQNDCPSCHMVEKKIIGPSYAEVASKYESTEENHKLLAERVIAGSVGIWGEIPMVPHPSLSQEDAEQMVKYILMLKK